jgi:ADP-heptose:LPS heptosyltransferase
LHESSLASKELLMGLNIGCGTPDALHKRPNLDVLADALGRIHKQTPFTLVLTGAAFERDINQAFITAYARQWGDTSHLIDWSGQVSISGLTGVIDLVDFFISTDSGPYHMAVAQRTPTLVLFTYPEVTSYHEVPWCVRLVAPYDAADVVTQFHQLNNTHATVNDRAT